MMKSVYPCKSAIDLLTQLMSYVVQLDRLYTKTTNQQQLFTIDKNQSLARRLVKMISIQNLSQGVLRASLWPFLYLQGNNMQWAPV